MVSLQRAFAYTKIRSHVVTGETSAAYWETMWFKEHFEDPGSAVERGLWTVDFSQSNQFPRNFL